MKAKYSLPSQRIEIIKKVLENKESVSRVCHQYNISRTLFYRWLSRYRQTGFGNRKIALLPYQRKIIRHTRQFSPQIELKVLRKIKSNPEYSSHQLASYLKQAPEKISVSNHGIWNIMRRFDLNKLEKRQEFSCRRSVFHPLFKKQMMDSVLSGKVPAARVCRQFGLSRTAFYRWLNRYQNSGQNLTSLSEKKPKVEHYWRQIGGEREQSILSMLLKHPEYSSHKIASVIPNVSNHGVYNVLKRNSLNTLERRIVYAETLQPQPTPSFVLPDFIQRIFGQIPSISALPPPAFTSLRRWLGRKDLLRFFASSLILTLLVTNGLVYWWQILAQTTSLSGKVGLIFASLSLAVGSFFFAYSLKYYLTLAVVLSFSRESAIGEKDNLANGLNGNGSSNGNGRGKNHGFGILGFLGRIFGFDLKVNQLPGKEANQPGLSISAGSTGSQSGSQGLYTINNTNSIDNPTNPNQDNLANIPRGIGLVPDLSGVKLTRYPFISIHLPLYNEKKVAERLLKACTQIDYPARNARERACVAGGPHFEIIVVDDSTDETTQILNTFAKSWNQERGRLAKKDYTPEVKILHRPTRQGFKGGALSLALKKMNQKTEFVVVFDADFVPYPDTLEQFLKYFQVAAGTLNFSSSQRSNTSEVSGWSGTKTMTPRMVNYQEALSLSTPYGGSKVAAVGGYQWHVLNKSENWITRGVRTEYAGSYVIERPGQEILGLLKQISGSVYLIRADILKEIGWGTSITEDFQLTLKLYDQGYKVVYTPYIQAPAECVSTLKRLIRQRMRWAEGHSNNIKKMFTRLMFGRWEETLSSRHAEFISASSSVSPQILKPASTHLQRGEQVQDDPSTALWVNQLKQAFGHGLRPNGSGPALTNVRDDRRRFLPSPLTLPEKLEFLYISPYYLQAAFFLIGTISWILAEVVFRTRLPFWTSLWGWSLVLTNLFSLPLMNTIGLFLEEAEAKDYLGIFSFILLSYLLVPFQAYASIKGFLEQEEGPWFRTPKTGRITDIFTRGAFYRWISGILPGWSSQTRWKPLGIARGEGSRVAASIASNQQSGVLGNQTLSPYLLLASANLPTTLRETMQADSRFSNFLFSGQRKKKSWLSKAVLAILLASLIQLSFLASVFKFAPEQQEALAFSQEEKKLYQPTANNQYLKIINLYSYPKQGENWEVKFKTIGKDDLVITRQTKETISDLSFVALYCGDRERLVKVDGQGEIIFPSWECPETAKLVHLVNHVEKHVLKFQFGKEVAYAFNGTIFTYSPALLDFEEGNLTDYDTTDTLGTGTNAASSTYKHGGTYSHRSRTTSGANGDWAVGSKYVSWPAGNVGYLRFFIYIDDSGTNSWSGPLILGGFYIDNNDPWDYLASVNMRPSDNLLYVFCYDTAYRNTGITYSASKDTWYEVQLKYDVSGTNASCQLWINGTSQGTWTGTGKQTNPPNLARIGVNTWAWDTNVWADAYYDDIDAENTFIPENLWYFFIIIPFASRFWSRKIKNNKTKKARLVPNENNYGRIILMGKFIIPTLAVLIRL